MPEGLGAHAKRVGDRGTDHEAMRDGEDRAGLGEHLVHPSGDALRHVSKRFATVRRGVRISQPIRDRGWLIGFNVFKRPSGPAAEIAIAQQRLDGGGKREAVGRLFGAKRGTTQDDVAGGKAAGKAGEAFLSPGIERLVSGKGDRTD